MRVILTGTRTFGASALRTIIDLGHDVAYVVAPPGDRTANEAAYDHRLTVSPEMDWQEVKSARADLIVAAHSHAYVGRKSRDATRLGAIGYHPSLLPRHRGRDSVEWTIRMNDPIAGGSVYWFTDGVDTGPIQNQDWCFVDRKWDASTLWRERLFPMGIRLLGDTLADLDDGRIIRQPQDPRFATTEPSLDPKYLHRPELLEIAAEPYSGPTFVAR